ncbi:hypothetical protein [Blautia sp. Marseille-P3087]|uniref:hypothetical protein n=1 Tax=Blautia sp. Marseille-P3087 TaxID=1917876 RepID=UPI000931E5C0|nr:hypothetical protein [Blautia sp. Marseille-P3087]
MNTNIPTITVDPELRELILPSEKLVLGINGDVEVNAVQFQLPLTYRELELKKLTPRINYVNPNGDTNYYESTMESDESNCYFIWPITPDITAYTGHVRFSLTLYQTEGDNILHKFNTRSAVGRVYIGFEAETQVTPEQQQTLLGKLETQIKADLNDHTEKLKNQLTEKGKEILDGFGESGSAVEELKNIKQDLNTKLTAPPTPEPGKILKIKSVNEDGTFVCEWADGGSNLDVRINGESIVQDGVAEIPIAPARKPGLVSIDAYAVQGGIHRANEKIGLIRIYSAEETSIDRRNTAYCPIVPANLDYAVKAAMCDGKGAAWTADEQVAARERMGMNDWELIAEITMPEDAEEANALTIDTDINGKSFRLIKARLCALFPKYTGESTIPNYSFMSINGVSTGPNAPLYYTSAWNKLSKNNRTGMIYEIDISGPQRIEKRERSVNSGWADTYYGVATDNIGVIISDNINIQSITSIGGTSMLIYPGCKFMLYGVRGERN